MASTLEPSSKNLAPRDFLPIRVLGHGDIGTVFLVQLCTNNESYAMKVMQKEVLRRKGVKRAVTERRVLSMLSHPFLPSLHAHFETEKHVFFIIDFCSGGDLNILRQKQPRKRFSESIARFYAAEVVLALEYLHRQGIVYRDLKPENILIQGNGHIMLTDFDLSLAICDGKPINAAPMTKQLRKRTLSSLFSCFSLRFCPSEGEANDCDDLRGTDGTTDHSTQNLQKSKIHKSKFSIHALSKDATKEPKKIEQGHPESRSHSFVGTEEYVAPEVLWGKGHGFPVDWWTLGIFLYEMVYGKTPFKGANRKETFYNILCTEPEFPHGSSSALKDLIRKLLAKEPASRLGSCRGADEVKKHAFFRGTAWKRLSEIAKPPFVPPPVHVHIDRRTGRIFESEKDEPAVMGNHKPTNDGSIDRSNHVIDTMDPDNVEKTDIDPFRVGNHANRLQTKQNVSENAGDNEPLKGETPPSEGSPAQCKFEHARVHDDKENLQSSANYLPCINVKLDAENAECTASDKEF
ncbi:hypothetical protein KP509_06G065400 [Ceratopteris richardii]|uniref:non-specific serine/threonine protein kinase n=1 Tax=Ceratopteris richardii TaxID=49495 RepID=A0A8T2UNS1_CERRI|nr:hypothetical protein KP509_06G065400 [Ceratopteris richardii]